VNDADQGAFHAEHNVDDLVRLHRCQLDSSTLFRLPSHVRHVSPPHAGNHDAPTILEVSS
jgi:hypothetical protein